MSEPGMTRFRPYPSYKDSGVEWLGKIPERWEAKPLKRIGRLRAGSGFPEDEQGLSDGQIPFYKVSDMTSEGNDIYMSEPFNTVTADTAARLGATVFPPDAIIFPKVGAALLTNKRRILTRPSCIDNNTMALVVRHGDVKYYYHWLCSIDMARLANPGAVPSMNESQARDISAPTPSLPEQLAIAAFLDRETKWIDALVEKKERLVELLQEKRTALISHAVTKGLDRNVRLKDSGVEWLGKTPEHWDVRRLRTVAYLQRGYDLTEDQRRDGTVLVVTSSGVDGYHDTAMARGPGVVTGRYGTVGKLHYIEGDYWPTNTTLFVRNFCGNVPRYVYHLLSTLPLGDQGGKSAVPGVDRKDLHVLPVARAPVSEQHAIAAFLDRETQRIDALVEKVHRSIELLKEYRTALISAAVTGKIDVRGAA